jgi:hypothetical protein
MCTGFFFGGVKRLSDETDRWAASNAEIKKTGNVGKT